MTTITDLTTDLHELDNFASQMLTDLQTGRLTADLAGSCIMSLGLPDLPADLTGKAAMLTELADRLAAAGIEEHLAATANVANQLPDWLFDWLTDLMPTADLANILADSDLTELPAGQVELLATAVARII